MAEVNPIEKAIRESMDQSQQGDRQVTSLKDYEIERFEHAGKTCVIYFDPDPPNPTKEYYELTHMACWHRRANLGHETIRPMSAKEIVKRARDEGDRVLAIMPLYLYEHSGMTISASKGNPYTCRWDSGQVGWAYVLESQARKMGCLDGTYTDRETGEQRPYTKADYEEIIVGDVSTYDDFLTGSCYGYEVLGRDEEHLDSCWGCYCGKKGIEYVRKIARDAAESCEDPAIEREAAELASRATYAGAGS